MVLPDQVNTIEKALLCAHMPEHVAREFRNYLLPFSLREGQIIALQCGLYWDRFGLYHDTRTGKTIVMVMLALFYLRYGLKSTFLLPPILFDQVKQEFKNVAGHSAKVVFIEGSAARKRKQLSLYALDKAKAPDVVFTTDDIFSGPPKTPDSSRNWRLFSQFSSCLFFDECHLGLQNEESAIYSAITKFLANADKSRLVLSTGTPMLTELAAAYPAISLKTPGVYNSRTHFDNYHVIRQQISVSYSKGGRQLTARVPKIIGYRNVELLSANLYKQAHRVAKFEVLDLHKPNIQVVPVKLSPAHYTLYKKLVTEAILMTDDQVLDMREQNGLRDLAQRLITCPTLHGAKIKDNAILDAIKAYARTVNAGSGGKLVVFANYNTSCQFLHGQLARFNPALIYGGAGSSGEKNRAEVAKFRNDRTCGIAVINPDAGGVGLTLGDICTTAVYAEPVSSPGKFEQSSARILLSGQTEPVCVYLLCAQGTYHTKTIRRLMEKTEEIRSATLDRRSMLSYLTED